MAYGGANGHHSHAVSEIPQLGVNHIHLIDRHLVDHQANVTTVFFEVAVEFAADLLEPLDVKDPVQPGLSAASLEHRTRLADAGQATYVHHVRWLLAKHVLDDPLDQIVPAAEADP